MKLPAMFLLSLFVSCSSATKKHTTDQQVSHKKAVYPTGKVIEKVHCEKDTTIAYTLYLPSKYDTLHSWPVIVFFDAEARGMLAVSRLKKVAEQLGYIVAGSLNSKNGLPAENYDYIAGTMIEDIRANLATDNRRLYTAGFSGGARQAMLLALKRADIAGVIGCSAGMPQWDQSLPSSFFYVGIAGRYDFNYAEMVNLETQLQGSPLQHQFLYRDGVHEMPTSGEFGEAVSLIHMNAIKTNLTDRNDSLVAGFIKETEEKISGLLRKKLLADADHSYAMLVSQLEGLTNISAFKEKMEELERSPEYAVSNKQKENAGTEEKIMQQTYSQAFSGQDINWWKKAITALSVQSRSSVNPYDALMKKRVLAYIALMAHMNYDAAVKQNNVAKEKDFLDIKVLAEPLVPMGYYLQAVYFSRTGNQQEALTMLRKALSLGFSDEPKLISEPLLSFIKSSPEYTKMIEKIRNNYQKELDK